MAGPRVSVLIPVHNAAPYLEEALDSVIAQTMGDFELLCLDDGSDDGSGEILRRYEGIEPRLRIFRPGRVGLIAGANQLRVEARCPLLARFDADDRMHPERLARQLALFDRNRDVDVVGTMVRHFPDCDVGEGNRRYESWLNSLVTHDEMARDFLVELPLPNPTAMFRAEVFDRVGGYVDDGLPEDYDFWLRAFQAGFRFSKVPEILHEWREHPKRVTRTHPRYSVESFLRAKVGYLLRGPLADGAPYVVWGAGMMGRRLTRLLVRAGRAPDAILDVDDKKVGRTRQGRPIIAVESFEPGSALVLGAVGARGARARIREQLSAWGLHELRGYWMVA